MMLAVRDGSDFSNVSYSVHLHWSAPTSWVPNKSAPLPPASDILATILAEPIGLGKRFGKC